MDELKGGVYWTPKENYVAVVNNDSTYQWLGVGYKMDEVYSTSILDVQVSPVTLIEWNN